MTILSKEEQIIAMWRYHDDMSLQWEFRTFEEYVAFLEYLKTKENR